MNYIKPEKPSLHIHLSAIVQIPSFRQPRILHEKFVLISYWHKSPLKLLEKLLENKDK